MVLESLSGLEKPERHPIRLFLTAFIIAGAAIFLTYNTFPDNSSVLAIAFIAVAFMPIMHSLFIREEQQEVDEKDVPFAFIATHFDVIKMYSIVFIGLVFAYSFMAVALPETHEGCEGIECQLPEKEKVFAEQQKVYYGITGKVIGEKQCFNDETKNFGACFELIFANNFMVMVLAIIFSFIWGAGAIFLLGWNASVIGMFIGLEVQSKSIEFGLLRAVGYLPHGIPEILAYLIAAIAGGIISAAISKQKFQKGEIKIVAIDTALLLLLATITLFIGAFIETAAIFNYTLLATIGILGFFLLYFILYIPWIRHKINQLR